MTTEQVTGDTEPFPQEYESDPPVPVRSSERVPNFVTDADAIPDDFVADEHVAKVGDLFVMRAGVECPRCESEVFLHPKSIQPRNSIYCYNCSHAPLSAVWWETPRLGSYADADTDCGGADNAE